MANKGVQKALFNINVRENHQRFVKSWDTFENLMTIRQNCLDRKCSLENTMILDETEECLKRFEQYAPDVYKGFMHRWMERV